MTVTATQVNHPANGMALRVMVLTNCAATQNGAVKTADAAQRVTITTTVTGSQVYGAAVASPHSASAYTAEPLSTAIDNINDATNNEQYLTFKSTSATGTPGPTLHGFDSAQSGGCCALEVLPNGTITEDASAPPLADNAGVFSVTTVTTASFTPPAGSLLVALVSSDGGSGITTMSVTDTGGGLSWSEPVKANVSSSDYAGVWIAQVPAVAYVPVYTQTSVTAQAVRRASLW